MREPEQSRVGLFRKYFSITHEYIGNRIYLLVLLNVLAAAVESVGILLFIPFLSKLTSMPAQGGIDEWLQSILRAAHLPVTVTGVLIALVFLFLLKGLLVFCFDMMRPLLFNRAGFEIREQILQMYAEVDYKYTMQKSSGFFSNLLVGETERACITMDSFSRSLASGITISILFSIAVFSYGMLSIAILIAGGVSLVLFRKFSEKARSQSLDLSSTNQSLQEYLIQALQSFKYLKSTAGFPSLQKRISDVNRDGKRIRNKIAALYAFRNSAQEPILVICLAIIFYYSIVIAGGNIPAIMAAVLFVYRCMIEVGHLHNHWQTTLQYAGGLETIWSVQQELREHREVTGTSEPALQDSIELVDVSFAYDETPILKDIHLVIPKNTSVAFVGISGAGKTTVVDLLTGLLKPVSGLIRIDGCDLQTMDLWRLRRKIGYVAQDATVFDDTIAGNISMQRSADGVELARVEKAARFSCCDEFIAQLPLGYQTVVGERGIRLSGGQRQRLAIARELFRDPEILILDEATSSLDSLSEKYIQESIASMHGLLTLIVISHRMSTIRNVDTIHVLDKGIIIASGTFEELMQRGAPIFSRMEQLQRERRA